MKKITQEWFKAAQDDLRVIEEIVNNENLTHAVAFHSQQAIEKTFKAIIEEYELEFVKTHDLIRLHEIVKNHLNVEWELDLLKKINDIYVDSRYPGELGLLPYGKPTGEDARKYYKFAKKVVEETKKNLK